MLTAALPQTLLAGCQRLTASLAAGNFETAFGEASSLVGRLRDHGGIVSTETLGQAERLLATPERRLEAVQAIQAMASAIIADHGPDAYVAEDRPLPFQVVLDGGPSPDALVRQVLDGTGQRVFRRATRFRRNPLRWIQDQMVTQMLDDDALKRRMIGFLDVAAGLPPDLLPEYFRSHFPRGTVPAKGLLGRTIRWGTGGAVPDALLRKGIEKTLDLMFRRFFLGETAEEAVEKARRLHERGKHVTLNVVTEHVVSPPEADGYLRRNLDLMALWKTAHQGAPYTAEGGHPVPARHISAKTSGMTHRFHPLAARQVLEEGGGRLLRLFQEARRHGLDGAPFLINLDPEDRLSRDLYYKLFWTTLMDPSLKGWDEAGLVVQCYLRDAETVMMRQIDTAIRTGKQVQIRLVKGAYHLYEQIVAAYNGWPVPVHQVQEATNACYLRQLRLALANWRHVRVVVATHNHETVAQALDLMREMQVPPWAVEFDFLNGVGEPNAFSLEEEGVIERMYGPFGMRPEAMPYETRRLGEINRQSAIGRTHVSGSFDDYVRSLMSPPQTAGSGSSESPDFVNEPSTNFADADRVRAVEAAMAELSGRSPIDVGPMIGDRPMRLDAAAAVASVNPANHNHLLGRVTLTTPAEVEDAVRFAQEGFAAWSSFAQEERSRRLRRAAEILGGKKETIAAEITANIGKPIPNALADVDEAIDFIRSYDLDAAWDHPSRAPLGVGVAICPFNFLAIAFGQAVGPLATGNAVILKPPDQTSILTRLVVETLREAGVPPKAIQYCPGHGDVGQRLVEHGGIDFVAFTGSKATADKILQAAAEHPSLRNGIKVVVAETGGKNPLIVDRSADLDMAVDAIIKGAFEMNGERCSAASRVIVEEPVADRLVERLVAAARGMVVANPSTRIDAQMGPQIDARSLAKARGILDEAKEKGTGRLVYEYIPEEGSDAARTPGHYLGPHIFDHVPEGSRLAVEEIFAPILSIQRVKDFNEAMRVANAGDYGLTAALISRNPDNIRRFFREIEAGVAYVNRAPVGARVWEQWFGGLKNSGTGPMAGGRDYVARFTRPRSRPWDGAGSRFSTADRNSGPSGGAREDIDATREAQSAWRATRPSERVAALRRFAASLSNADLAGQLKSYADQAERLLTPQDTHPLSIELSKGEINKVVFDRPMGVGLVWGDQERASDTVRAVAAALVMGNAVVLPDNAHTRDLAAHLESAGFPAGIVRLTQSPLRDLIKDSLFDFAVAHGPQAAAVQTVFTRPDAGRVGFGRFIGVTDSPEDRTYLSRFAQSRTLILNTLRHGILIYLPEVFGD